MESSLLNYTIDIDYRMKNVVAELLFNNVEGEIIFFEFKLTNGRRGERDDGHNKKEDGANRL